MCTFYRKKPTKNNAEDFDVSQRDPKAAGDLYGENREYQNVMVNPSVIKEEEGMSDWWRQSEMVYQPETAQRQSELAYQPETSVKPGTDNLYQNVNFSSKHL